MLPLGLKEHLKAKLPEINHKIYHLNDINSIIKNISDNESILTEMADSSLIIFDECHCDAEINKIMDKFRCLLKDISKENKTSFKKLSCSATPYEQIIAKYPKVILKPSDGYYGLRHMIDSTFSSYGLPVVFQSKNLENMSECEDLMTEIEVVKKYYIFRLPGKYSLDDKMMSNLETCFKDAGLGLNSYIYDMSYRENINVLINDKPSSPTLIFLKDKLRMGEYLNTRYVYMVHDTPSSTYTHTAVQSLIGRCCGYGKESHHTNIYCDYKKIIQHSEWIKHNYDIKHVPCDAKYISKRDKYVKDICIF